MGESKKIANDPHRTIGYSLSSAVSKHLDPQSESADFHEINDGAGHFHSGETYPVEAAGKQIRGAGQRSLVMVGGEGVRSEGISGLQLC